MPNIEVPSPPPPSARKEQLERYASDVENLRRSAAAANLIIKHEMSLPNDRYRDLAGLSRKASDQLGAILADIEEALASLQDRRTVIIPHTRHAADNMDKVYAIAYDALQYIFNLEALLDTMRRQLDQQPNGHLITLADLCFDQLPKLRFALYGEEMGP